MNRPIIVWLHRNLRLADNAVLAAACQTGAPVIPVFILDDAASGGWATGGAARWWLHASLSALGRDLAERGGRLVLRRGDSAVALDELAAITRATAVYCARGYEPWAQRLETSVRDRLAGSGVEVRRFAGALLREPEEVRTKAGDPFRVYTPFWRALTAGGFVPPRPRPAPGDIPWPRQWPAGEELETWCLQPSRPNWAKAFGEHWTPGEAGARNRLSRFGDEAITSYRDHRDRPNMDATSRLSPHLHFGEISPAQCWHTALAASARGEGGDAGPQTFLRELAWREFSHHLLFHWPDLPTEPFRREFAAFPWRRDPQHLRAWQRGMTGYPIVDAGMRQLWATGWMHNRVRMIVASFLVKDLLIPWQDGAAWFWDTLVDADLANNSASWQWVAGSGADAAPYFRIFNPVRQGETFDPEGDYVRRWVPELARLPARDIHAPWLAPAAVLAAAGVKIDGTYPAPIVDHKAARERALAAFEAVKHRAAYDQG